MVLHTVPSVVEVGKELAYPCKGIVGAPCSRHDMYVSFTVNFDDLRCSGREQLERVWRSDASGSYRDFLSRSS